MPTKYLLIDDEPEAMTHLSGCFAEDIRLDYAEPNTLESTIDKIREWIARESTANTLGILLDWRLREGPAAVSGAQIPRAATLAQEIRSLTAEGSLQPLPIVVVSSLERIAPTWSADTTAHDLFDAQILKDQVADSSYRASAVALLQTLSSGYAALAQSINDDEGRRFPTLLGWPEHGTPPIELDPRIQADFEQSDVEPIESIQSIAISAPARPTVHEYARFFIRELLETPGPLIDEMRLGALLGIDIDPTRSSDWRNLVERDLRGGQYTGPFASSYQRWWASWIENWWRSTVDTVPRSPRAYDAPDRVARIVQSTHFTGLVAAEPILPTYSRRYTTICEVFQRPLDPVNGLRLQTREPKPWQTVRFASEEAVRTRRHRNRWIIHPSDVPRAKELQSAE